MRAKKIIKVHKTKDVPALIIGGQVINYRDYDEDTGKLDRMIRAALKGERLDLIANQSPEAKENLDLSTINLLAHDGLWCRLFCRLQSVSSGHSGLSVSHGVIILRQEEQI